MKSSSTDKPVTALDEALAAARANAGEANYFFDAFLNTSIFMPVQLADGEKALGRPVGTAEKFFPLFLTYENTRVVPLFDESERLKNWARDKTYDYLYLRAHLLLGVLAPGVGAVINLGTPWSYYFVPDVLDRLRGAMKPVEPA